MDTLKRALFEDPVYLYAALGVIFLVLVASLRPDRRKRAAVWLLLPILAAGAVFLVERTVVTDRERIDRRTRKVIEQINAGRYARIADYLDPHFEATGYGTLLTIDAVEQGIRRAVRSVGFESAELLESTVAVEGNFATQDARVRVRLTLGPQTARWRVKWVRVDGQWKIRDVELVEREGGLLGIGGGQGGGRN